jgi:hypothetical protein
MAAQQLALLRHRKLFDLMGRLQVISAGWQDYLGRVNMLGWLGIIRA